MTRLALQLASMAALSSCFGAPNEPSAAQRYTADVVSRNELLPAGRVDREQAATLPPIERAAFWNEEYAKAPADPAVALALARALHDIESYEKAAEIAAGALTLKPADPQLSEIYALAALERARPDLAASALIQAEANFGNGWKLYSLLGIALDQNGQHKKARIRYNKALRIVPDHPAILTNLALSHLLAGDPETAEATLREVASRSNADTRVRQNFALILGVQGKFKEAARFSAEDLTPGQIRRNIGWYRRLLAPKRSWRTSAPGNGG